MYVEKRIVGKNKKYYLVHSYRADSKVKKIRKYLGFNLTEESLKIKKNKAEKIILTLIQELNTEIFRITLSRIELEKLNKYDIEIRHLDKKDWKRFTEEFTYNTNAIEGSTVLQEEVPKILKTKKPKNLEEVETIGVANAIEYIKKTKEDLSINLIKKIHELCFKGSKEFAGELRDVEVVIRNAHNEIIHTGTPASELKTALKEFIKWYHENKTKFKPLVLAAIVHNEFEHIHPFQDGNGRVGRLLLNFILTKHNYPPIDILLKNRAKYYECLNEYSKNNDLKPTLNFLINQYKKTLKKR